MLSINCVRIIIFLAFVTLAKTARKSPSNLCDDEHIRALQQKLDLVVLTNQNIQLKLDALNISNQHLLEELQNKILEPPNPAIIPSFCVGDKNGIQPIQIANSKQSSFYVNCIQDSELGSNESWVLIQRRIDGDINFHRDWSDYQQGFGNLDGSFFVGLDNLHALTQSALFELWIKMVNTEDEIRWAKYSLFGIGDENQGYALNMLGNYSGNAGDALRYHAGQKFTTKDRDHDDAPFNCAVNYEGAWWYKHCRFSDLNGNFLITSDDNSGKGIAWETWKGLKQLKYVHMAIRPVKEDN